MRFNTHDRTPRPNMSKTLKILFLINGGLVGGLFLFFGVYASFTVKSIAPAIVILPLFLLAVVILLFIRDTKNAYVETKDDSISVVDYYFGIKKEKSIPKQEISCAEIQPGESWKKHGIGFPYCCYIVFRDREGKYLFKVFYTLETMRYFEQYLKQSEEKHT